MPPPTAQKEFAESLALVVDDSPLNRDLVTILLQSLGVGRIDIAADGIEALEKVAAQPPDIILLDIMMPRMDGLEFLRRFRAQEDYADIPVLVTTALNESEDRARAFDSGASDFIAKPIDRRELMARVSVHLRNSQMVQSLKTYRDRLGQDLDIAAKMQSALLPTPDQIDQIGHRFGLTLSSISSPISEISGDLWGWAPLDQHSFAIWLADFSGHGIAAAINTFRLHLILSKAAFMDPAAMLAHLNLSLVEVLPRGQFATMLYAVCDTLADTLTFSSAGATAPVLCTPGGRAGLHPASSLPLGVRPDTRYGNVELPFPKGSRLMLYSDGLSEATDAAGAHLGEEGVRQVAQDLRHGEDFDDMLQRLKRQGFTFADDVSALWLAG